jgi:hypothetical protein
MNGGAETVGDARLVVEDLLLQTDQLRRSPRQSEYRGEPTHDSQVADIY